MDTLLHLGLSNAVTATVLALVAGGAALLLRRRPALVHAVLTLVLIKLVTPPLVCLPAPWSTETPAPETPPRIAPLDAEDTAPERHLHVLAAPAAIEEADAIGEMPPQFVLLGGAEAFAPEEPVEDPSLSRTEIEPRPAGDRSWLVASGVVWALGSLGWFLLAAMRVVRFGRLLRLAPTAPERLQQRTHRLAQRLGLSRCPPVRIVPGRLSPMLWSGWGTPQLLIPAGLLGQVRDDQLDTILLHELAHLRRRDHWVRALEFVTLGLYWWHPAVWWARHELREAEEQCCDAWVVSVLDGSRRSYAEALVETLDFLSQAAPVPPPLASGIGHVSDLKRRLTMILSGTTPRALSWRGGLTVLGLGALLPLLPAWVRAQPPPAVEKDVIRFRIVNTKEEADADADKMKAEIQKLEAELRKKVEEVHALENRLREAQARLHKPGGAVPMLGGARVEVVPGTTERRVIVWQLKDTDAKPGATPSKGTLYELVPGEKGTLILRPVAAPGGKVEGPGWKIEVPDVKVTPRGVPVPPLPPMPIVPPGVRAPADPRTMELEKRLDELTRQLEQLRKELKTPPPGKLETKPPARYEVKPKPVDQTEEARTILELRLKQAELQELVEALRQRAEEEAARARKAREDAERKK